MDEILLWEMGLWWRSCWWAWSSFLLNQHSSPSWLAILPYFALQRTPWGVSLHIWNKKQLKKKENMTLVIFVSLGRVELLAVHQTPELAWTALSWAGRETELFSRTFELPNHHFTVHSPCPDPPALQKRPFCPTPGQHCLCTRSQPLQMCRLCGGV